MGQGNGSSAEGGDVDMYPCALAIVRLPPELLMYPSRAVIVCFPVSWQSSRNVVIAIKYKNIIKLINLITIIMYESIVQYVDSHTNI